MLRLDAHQHFWKYDPVKDAWITDEMAVLKRDFMPEDLSLVLHDNAIGGCVAVQASQSEAETDFLIDLAAQNSFVKGVVGWVDLQADNIEERLQYYREYSIVKGFRHIIQAENAGFMLSDKFQRGISLLDEHGFSYDILIKPQQLEEAAALVAQFPRQQFVIDHMAKPLIKQRELEPWREDMIALAKHKNVWCKVSGFCTEADWQNWTFEDIKPYLDTVFEAFGIDRLMFGSDWPVCLLAGGYSRTISCLNSYLKDFTDSDKAKFWGGNAASFYQINS
ncbi:amidohydrolase [Mucilaginibacter terrenus]|uniref:Amidohydrolase n=1 Tax=Mucilaginibacter terrenus TaxID=2482727 RepID=A0A3E2NTB6_9SPHI|nr:amidohydrolase family protein [Mucilaginibacter terrenus]RFZ84244.1 amidohydrolase [Mucilaginibacter terrenus]